MGMIPPSTLLFCRLEVRWRWGADVGFVQWARRRCNVPRCRSRRLVCQDLRQGSAHQGSLVRLQACPSRHLQGSGPHLGTSRLIHTSVTFLCSLPSQLPVVKDPESVTYSSSRLCCLFVQYSLKALLLFAADAARATVPCFPSECAMDGRMCRSREPLDAPSSHVCAAIGEQTAVRQREGKRGSLITWTTRFVHRSPRQRPMVRALPSAFSIQIHPQTRSLPNTHRQPTVQPVSPLCYARPFLFPPTP